MIKNKNDKSIMVYLRELQQLFTQIFSFYIKRNYHADPFFYEEKLIRQTRLVMKAMQIVRKKIIQQPVISCLEELYEITFSLSLLKNRLLDHATFEVCETELRHIFQILSSMMDLSDNANKTPASFEMAMQALEVVFQNTIQFIVADPMIFLFFMRDLKSFNQELHKLHRLINEK